MGYPGTREEIFLVTMPGRLLLLYASYMYICII